MSKSVISIFIATIFVIGFSCDCFCSSKDLNYNNEYKVGDEPKCNNCDVEKIENLIISRVFHKIDPVILFNTYALTFILVALGIYSLGAFIYMYRIYKRIESESEKTIKIWEENIKKIESEGKKTINELKAKHEEYEKEVDEDLEKLKDLQYEFIKRQVNLCNTDSVIWINLDSLLAELYCNNRKNRSFKKAKKHLNSIISLIKNSAYKLQLISHEKTDQVEAAHYFYGEGEKSDLAELKKAYESSEDKEVKELLWEAILKISSSEE